MSRTKLDPSDAPLFATLAAVVAGGSFTAAAARLRVSKSVVSERVRSLEDRLGVALLERTTRRQRVTDAGARALELARELDAIFARASDLAAADRAPAGRLRVATTVDLGVLLVGPAAARLVAAHPGVQVEVLADDAARDPLEEAHDVSVRLGALRPSSRTARRLASFEEPIVAAPALAARLRAASRPSDLSDAPWVRHALLPGRALRFVGRSGATCAFEPRVQAEASTGLAVLALLLHGAGAGCLPDYMVREHLSAGRLVRLCPGWIWKVVTLYVLLPPRPAVRPLHRIFVDELRAGLALDAARFGRGGE